MPLRTLVVDDHEAVCKGLTELLSETDVDVIRAVGDGKTAIEYLTHSKVDAALIDVQMKKMDGLTLLSNIRKTHPELPVVIISAYDYPVYVARAAANGAHDFVLKQDSAKVISRSLWHAHEHRTASPDGLLHRIHSKLSEPIRPQDLPAELPITSREAQVLRHVAFGLSNREAASSLGISVETVKEHMQNILRKTGATDRTDIAVRAVRLGLVD
jgi:DNA-binding NarL/FixJ family response regulator